MGYGTLIQRIVYRISGRILASSGLYTPSDNQYDYAIGGIPFLSATSDTRPDTEKPVPQRKDQFDNYKDPGEYSLSQWWLRSQSSFIGGEGIIYQDPDTQGASKNTRFAHSVGVDPFTDPDLLSLQRRVVDTGAMDADATRGPAFLGTYEGDNANDIWIAKGRTITNFDVLAGSLSATGTATLPSAGTAFIANGLLTFDSTTGAPAADAYVYHHDPGSAANTGIWKASGQFAITTTRIYVASFTTTAMAKARGLIAFGGGNSLYMLDPYAAANTALPAANATVPADQAITAITDGPDAVYVAANSDTQGYIYKTTFNSSGVVNGLTLTAVLPQGERINSISAYVNTFLVITTQTGVRIGSFTGDGVEYSPSIINVTQELGAQTYSNFNFMKSGFGRIAFWKNFAFITTLGEPQHDDQRGLMCVDMSTVNQDSNTGSVTNAYCTWTYLQGNTRRVYDVAVTVDGRTVQSTLEDFPSTVTDVALEHATELVDMGYLDTGRCRFNTIEPKLFKFFSIRTPTPLLGEITVAVLDDGGGITPYITYGPTLTPDTNDIATPTPGGPRNWEALRFTLRRSGTDATVGGVLDSWQIKALPGTLKQRMITRNFLCFNSEQDRTGQTIGGDTYSLERLTAIRQMCQRGDTVTLQDLANNISDQVVIDDYQFTMMAPPGPNLENYGGYLTVMMRTVADSVPPVSLAGSDEE